MLDRARRVRCIVAPAASRPTMRMRMSFLPKPANSLPKMLPISSCWLACCCLLLLLLSLRLCAAVSATDAHKKKEKRKITKKKCKKQKKQEKEARDTSTTQQQQQAAAHVAVQERVDGEKSNFALECRFALALKQTLCVLCCARFTEKTLKVRLRSELRFVLNCL